MRGLTFYQRPLRMAGRFDGSAWLETSQGILKTDQAQGIFSCFIRREAGDKGIVLECIQAQGALVLRIAIHETLHYAFIDIRMGMSVFFAASKPYLLLPDGTWHHVLISWDVNHPGGQKRIGLYIDDRESLDLVQDNAPAFIPQTSSRRWRVGASIASKPLTLRATIADLYLELGQFTELSCTKNRRAWVSAYGTPVRPDAYRTPQLFLTGESLNIGQHAGTAPELTGNGNIPLESITP